MNADAIIGGMMMVGAAASAVSGGASASGGQTVVTGDSEASVQVTNVINADNDGGTSYTIIEKTINGVKEITEETKTFKPGESVKVEVNAEARSGGASTTSTVPVSVTSQGVDGDEEGDAATTTDEDASEEPANLASFVFETVSNFFASVWGLFSW